MNKNVGFPTHGEVVRFVFDAFGLLPRKEARDDSFNETDKKTLQKRLARLASEEGDLNENYLRAVEQFHELISRYLPTAEHHYSLVEVLKDLDSSYAGMISREGTYLTMKESVQFFISTKAVPRFLLALRRCMLFPHPATKDLSITDDPFWYLPTRNMNGSLVMPLAKVMRWAYEACGLSQKQFHSPGKLTDQTQDLHTKNLENALNWLKGDSLPSLPALLKNFKEAFTANSEINHIEEPLKQQILHALIYARLATYIAREISDTYGHAFLDALSSQIVTIWQNLKEEVDEFLKELKPTLEKQESEHHKLAIWIDASVDHETYLMQKLALAEGDAHKLASTNSEQKLSEDQISFLTKRYGQFAVHVVTDRMKMIQAIRPKEVFGQLLETGLHLKSNPTTSLSHIDQFERAVEISDYKNALCWLSPWVRGAYFYRQDDYVSAFTFYQEAFEAAKYCAGSHQYKLVNQYIELAAKLDKAVPLKKGIDWAGYLGIQVRWLRDKEPTPENLEYLRSVMKIAEYSHEL